jgi:predicted ATP-binding protein involved in virulence
MSHDPTPSDVASDLLRCVNATISPEGFENPSYKHFLKSALNTLPKIKEKVDRKRIRLIRTRLNKAINRSLEKVKRQEDLLMASSLLLHS